MEETINYYEGSTSGAPIRSETINYGYSDTNWTDKMTSYNGQNITYDEMTMTWKTADNLPLYKREIIKYNIAMTVRV